MKTRFTFFSVLAVLFTGCFQKEKIMKRTNLLALTLLLLLCAVSQGDFRFVAWADNRPYDQANRDRFVWMLQEMNRIVVDELLPLPPPLFHVVPGDYDDTETTQADITNVSRIKTWHRAPGNHDDLDLDWPNRAFYLGDPQALFLFLNEYKCPAGDCECSLGRVCEHTLAWLYGQCSSATGYPIFVVGHEPAFPENAHEGDSLNLYPGERDAFWAFLKQYRATYICGHTHYYSTYSSGGATQIDVGNAGNPREPEQTFVVVVVTDTDVTFTTWQGLIDEAYFERESWTVDLATAFNPSPADGATQVAVDTDLSWTAGAGAQSHDVYFGTDPSSLPLESEGQSTTTYDPDPGTLVNNTTYYWRIDEFDGSTTHQGDVWSFTTFVPELPWIDGFESGSFAAGGWSTSSQATVVSSAAYTGNYGALLKKTAWIEKAVSTVGYDSIYVKYARKTKGLDTDEYLLVEWYDGSTWLELERTRDNSSWSSVEKTCGIGADDEAKANFKIRFSTNGNAGNDEAMVDDVEITNIPPAPDNTPPTPDPLTWYSPPSATGPTSISMTADTASDPSGVEYYFDCTDGGGHDSDWQDSETYEDTGLSPGTTYTYQVKARDKSANQNENETWSTEESATTTESGTTMHVESIDVSLLPTGKNWKAVAAVVISPAQAGATVVGDWYLNESRIQTGATGVTDGVGYTKITLPPKKAESGNTFKFVVTDVVLSSYVYDPGQGVTEGAYTVP